MEKNNKKRFQKMMVAVCCSCLTVSTVQLVSAEGTDWTFWQSYYTQQSAYDAYNDVSNSIIFDDGSSLSTIIDNGQGYFGSYLKDMDQDGVDELIAVGSWYEGGGKDAAKMEVWIYDYENGQIIGTKAYELYYAGSDLAVMQTASREVTAMIHEKSDGSNYVMVLEKGRRVGSDIDYISSSVIEYDGPGQIKEMVNISSAYKEYEEENLFEGYTEEKAVFGLNDLRSETKGDLLIADLKRENQSSEATIRTEYKSLSSVAEGYSTLSDAEGYQPAIVSNATESGESTEVISKAYNLQAINEVKECYDWSKPYLELLKGDNSFSYRMIANYYEEHKFVNFLTNISASILGKNISEDEYIEMLSEITEMNQYAIAEQIEKYGSYNTTSDIVDFIFDAADVVFDVADLGELLNCSSETSKMIYNTLKYGEKVGSKSKEWNEMTEDLQKYCQAFIENYTSSIQFLTAVSKNSNVKNLKSAAKKLILANDSIYRKAYYVIKKADKNIRGFSSSTFVNDIMTPASEMAMESTSDEKTKKIFKNIATIGENISTFNTVFNLMMFVGNYTFGTSDTFEYLQKIKAIDEIASCVIGEIDNIDVDSYADGVEQYKAIIDQCLWYRWLITINGRGESYACTMLTDENNGLVDIDDLIAMFKGEITIKDKYDLQLNTLSRFDSDYLQPIFDVDVFASNKSNESENMASSIESNETENADAVNKYLEFVKQYEGEAFYSIENIKEGKRPILLMTFLTEDAWDYEFIDDENVHSSTCEIYDYINGDIVKVGSLISFAGYLSLYEKADNFYIATRSNAHSYCFNCIKNNAIYTYGYNTNNIVEDTVEYKENSEYYNYAYGTANYDNAIRQYSEVECISFKNNRAIK